MCSNDKNVSKALLMLILRNSAVEIKYVHRCCAGASMRVYHAAEQGSTPVRDKFPE